MSDQQTTRNTIARAARKHKRAGLVAWTAVCAMLLVTGARSGEPARSTALAPPPTPQIKPAPPTPIAVQKVQLEGSNPWNPSWDVMIEKSLPRELLSKDRAPAVRELCPRFGTMTLANRRAFWAYFFQALAAAEAGLRPTADVRHMDPEVAIPDSVTHRIVRQEGLLQLTYMDSRRYRCAFDWNRDKNLPEHDPNKTILQPENNLMCGIRILDRQLTSQHKRVLDESSYWVTLRPGHTGFEQFMKQMANVPEACGAHFSNKKTVYGAPVSHAEAQQPIQLSPIDALPESIRPGEENLSNEVALPEQALRSSH